MPCDGSSSLMRTGSISLCLPARAASNGNYESGSGNNSFYRHEISGVYPRKGEFFMSWVCTRRHASGNGTCAGSPVPSAICWCRLIQDRSSSAQVPMASPKCPLFVSEETTSRISRKKAILRRHEQGWSRAGAGLEQGWGKRDAPGHCCEWHTNGRST